MSVTGNETVVGKGMTVNLPTEAQIEALKKRRAAAAARAAAVRQEEQNKMAAAKEALEISQQKAESEKGAAQRMILQSIRAVDEEGEEESAKASVKIPVNMTDPIVTKINKLNEAITQMVPPDSRPMSLQVGAVLFEFRRGFF